MNTENRLRAMFGRADDALRPQAPDWEGFVERAHRRVRARRAIAFAAAAALVVVGTVGSRALISGRDSSTPPADELPPYEENPVDVREVSATCPEAPGFETGELGAVAYFRDGELHVVDLTTKDDRVLVTGIGDPPASPVRWSPDGRWISIGGYVVPTVGGGVCTPLAEDLIDAQWAGQNLMVAQGEGVVLIGGPGRQSQEIQLEGGNVSVTSHIVNPETTLVAVGGNRRPNGDSLPTDAGIWLFDPDTQESHQIANLPEGSEPVMAGWSPDGRWILFWQLILGSQSIGIDGAPLYAVPVSGGQPVKVLDSVLVQRDFLTWCGDTLVAASGSDRYVTVGKRLVSASPPDWTARELATQPRNRSVFWPDCSPDGGELAVTSSPDEKDEPLGSLTRSMEIFPVEAGGEAGVGIPSGSASLEFPRWSRNHDYREHIILHVRREPEPGGRSALYLLDEPMKIADLGTVYGIYGEYSYWGALDWYQP